MRRREADAERGETSESKSRGHRIQTLLERNSDWVYGTAAFFVALAIFIVLFTPISIEVDAAGNAVRQTRVKIMPAGFKVKLSKFAHRITDSIKHADWSPHSELNGMDVSTGMPPSRGLGQEISASVGGGVGGALSSESANIITADNNALRQEVSDLRATVEHLEQALQTTTCLSITAAREGLCLPPPPPPPASAPSVPRNPVSTRSKAVLRQAGYRREHARWHAAKDHWATQYVNMHSLHSRVGFQINTHNPDTEDIYISRAAHKKTIWDKPVFNVFKHVLMTKGLPPGRVLDIGGNIGYFTLWGLAMGHKVTTFEPMDFNLRYIVTSIDANGFGANHTLYQNAVGNQAGRLSLLPTNKQNRGNYQVQPASAAESTGEYGFDYVETIKLDDVVDEDVLLVKIDVEGFEHKVLDGARKLVCSRLVRYIEFEFTTSKTDAECHAEQVLCWFSTIGYRLTSVDDVEHADKAATKELSVHDWPNFPSELLLTLKDPLLPPGLLLELSGTWNNPCRSLVPPRDDAHWEPYKERWCAAKLAAFSHTFAPCNIWGGVPAVERRVYSAIGCDTRLGFDCNAMTLDRSILEQVTRTYPYSAADASAADASATVDEVSSSEWLTGWYNSYGHYYKGTIDR